MNTTAFPITDPVGRLLAQTAAAMMVAIGNRVTGPEAMRDWIFNISEANRLMSLGAGEVISPDEIIAEAAVEYGVRARDISGYCGVRCVVRARHAVFARMAEAGYTLSAVGYLVASDDRLPFDHSTVSNGIKSHKARAS